MTPRVTVLLAVHNGEPYVRDAVASMLEQTYRDFEFVIVDDASTDGTVATIESFGDDRIRLLRNAHNLGQVPSLNRGLQEARGDIIARIDADDVSHPQRLAKQVAVLDANPSVALVGSWMTLVDERGRKVGALRRSLRGYADFIYHTLIMRVYVAHPAALYRRAPVLEVGGYDERTGPAEDKDLWRKLALAGWDARIVEEPLVRYRLHDAQLSQTRAEYQREVDARSQERFLMQLAPEAPHAAVRMLLADDPELWRRAADIPAALAGVDAVLCVTRERLGLDDVDSRRLRDLIGRRLIAVGTHRWWVPQSRLLIRRGLALVPVRARVTLVPTAVPIAALAPARAAAGRITRKLARTVPPLRTVVRRSNIARRIYAVLVGQSMPSAPMAERGHYRSTRVERDVTLVVKTFERPQAPHRLIESVRRIYPEMRVVLVDDSADPLEVVPDRVEYCRLTFNSGLAAGRNEGLRRVTTPYVLFADDDHVFTEDTDVEKMLRVLQTKQFDIVSCRSIEHRSGTNETWEKHYAGTIDVIDHVYHHRIGVAAGYRKGLPVYGIVLNFFLADRSRLGDDPWDPRLKIGVEHADFFLTAKRRGLLSTKISTAAIHHHADWSSESYMSFRADVDRYTALWRDKWGIEREVVDSVSPGYKARAARIVRRAGSRVAQPL
jgi:glycosyltransferase involved in cell wall biosynthesis